MAEQIAFAGACIELFSQLWAQLESMASEDCLHCSAVDAAFQRRMQILRLELIVLLDACRAARWRLLLDADQRRTLEQCLSDVLDCLNTRFEEAPLRTLEGAQNRLLDAVLEQHRVANHDRIVGQTLCRATA